MFESINRMEGTNVDWSQLPNMKRKTSQETSVDNSNEQKQSLVEQSKEKLHKELEKINKQYSALDHSLRMRFNEDAEQFYVEVIDIQTREVIDSIPAKHVLDLAAKLKEMVGFFIDEKR